VSTLPSDATILLDCLSLWVSNLLLADEEGTLDEARMSLLAQGLLEASQGRSGTLIMVTSEVGCGLVPEHPLSRRFRDLVGRCNQVMAAEAEQVFQVVCGIAVAIK
jgi:adenosylcobinamide kinase/adenosylcobinamide-phosphate guanylyltransferase